MTGKTPIRILALDTSTHRGSVALLDGPETVAEFRLNSLATHSQRLLRSMHFLLEAADWKAGCIGLVAAGIGPGSFTGIRIGVATALGLAQSLGSSFAAVTGFDALASMIPAFDTRLGIVFDAQRSQVYYAEYDLAGGKPVRRQSPRLVAPGDLARDLRRRRILLAGDGAWRYAAELRAGLQGYPRLVAVDLFLASAIGRIALGRRRSWKSGEQLQCDPLYIRPPDARKPGRRKN